MAGRWNGKGCPVCGVGTLHDNVRSSSTDYRGEKFVGMQAGAYCDKCGDGIVYDDPTFDSKWDEFRATIDAKQAAELAGYRKKLGISQQVASKLSGGGHNAFSRYERQEAQPVMGVLILFRLLNDLLTENPFLLRKYVPGAQVIYDLAHASKTTSLSTAVVPRRQPPTLSEASFPSLQSRRAADESMAMHASSWLETYGEVAGVTQLPSLNVSSGRVYSVGMYPTQADAVAIIRTAREMTAADARTFIMASAGTIHAASQGKSEDELTDTDWYFKSPPMALIAKPPRPAVRAIKVEKPRKRVQAE